MIIELDFYCNPQLFSLFYQEYLESLWIIENNEKR